MLAIGSLVGPHTYCPETKLVLPLVANLNSLGLLCTISVSSFSTTTSMLVVTRSTSWTTKILSILITRPRPNPLTSSHIVSLGCLSLTFVFYVLVCRRAFSYGLTKHTMQFPWDLSFQIVHFRVWHWSFPIHMNQWEEYYVLCTPSMIDDVPWSVQMEVYTSVGINVDSFGLLNTTCYQNWFHRITSIWRLTNDHMADRLIRKLWRTPFCPDEQNPSNPSKHLEGPPRQVPEDPLTLVEYPSCHHPMHAIRLHTSIACACTYHNIYPLEPLIPSLILTLHINPRFHSCWK